MITSATMIASTDVVARTGLIVRIGAVASTDVIAATQRAGPLERRLGRELEASHRTVERTASGGARDGC